MSFQDLNIGLERLVAVTGSLPDTRFKAMADELRFRIDFPTPWATFVGETSSGKSTLINSFLKERLFPTGVKPTSGSIAQIVFVEPEDMPDGDMFRKLTVDRTGSLNVEELLRGNFVRQCQEPSSDLKRLMVFTARKGADWKNFQIFDTPGYNSLIESHGEVLTEFVPRCDVVIMVVGYRTGFGLVEQKLLETVYETCRDLDTSPPVILVVNRAPEGADLDDKRVKEIVSHSRDCLHDRFDCFVVRSVKPPEDGSFIPLDTEPLFKRIFELTLSPEAVRKSEATVRFASLMVCDEAMKALAYESEGLKVKMQSRQGLLDRIVYLEKVRNGCSSKIDFFFKGLERSCATLVKSELTQTRISVHREVDNSSKWTDASECSNFVCVHTVPFGVKQARASLQEHLRSGIAELNADLRDYVNSASRDYVSGFVAEGSESLDLVVDVLESMASTIGRKIAFDFVANLARVPATEGAKLTADGKKSTLFAVSLDGKPSTLKWVVTGHALRALNIGLGAVVDVFASIKQTFTWQEDLKKRIGELLDHELDPGQENGIMGQMKTYIAALREQNMNKLPALFDHAISLLRTSHDDSSDPKEGMLRASTLAAELGSVRAALAKEN
jgi:GTPase SAR1 family protein